MLSRDFLHPTLRRLIPATSFGKITLLFTLVIGVNLGQSLWIYTERTPRSFPIPGVTYSILPRGSSDLNSLTRKLPTLYAINNLYISLDELTTKPRVYSVDKLIPPDAENQSKFYGTIWPEGEVEALTDVDKDQILRAISDIEPTRIGTVYATLRVKDPGDPGVDWRIYTAKNDASTSEIVALSEAQTDRRTWIFIDLRLLNPELAEEVRQ